MFRGLHVLEHLLATLFLRGEAGDGPHFDLDAVVELFAPHVPHSLVGCSDSSVLQTQKRVQLDTTVTQQHRFSANQNAVSCTVIFFWVCATKTTRATIICCYITLENKRYSGRNSHLVCRSMNKKLLSTTKKHSISFQLSSGFINMFKLCKLGKKKQKNTLDTC